MPKTALVYGVFAAISLVITAASAYLGWGNAFWISSEGLEGVRVGWASVSIFMALFTGKFLWNMMKHWK